MANAQTLERLAQAIGALEGQIRAQPVPENDRMTERYRQEAPTLQKLLDCDMRLAGQAEIVARDAGSQGRRLDDRERLPQFRRG